MQNRRTVENMRQLTNQRQAKQRAVLQAGRAQAAKKQDEEAKKVAQKQAVQVQAAMAIQVQSAQQKAKKKQVEANFHVLIKPVILHLGKSVQHWGAAMAALNKLNAYAASQGINPMQLNYYKKLQKIDDVFEGMKKIYTNAVDVSNL